MKKQSAINNQQLAIKITNLSKKYILHHQKPTLVENIFRWGQKEELWALKNINMEIRQGDSIGLLGKNGSGKTTFLKIIAGITTSSSGQIQVNGKVVTLIDINSGFHPELTGEENIYLNGMLLGMSQKEIKKEFCKIIQFSGLKKFIDAPFYTYSNGMKFRLGFSIAIHSKPDILLIDEIIGGGDKIFIKKAYQFVKNFIKDGKTFVFASHFSPLVKKFCQRAAILENGQIKIIGETKKIIDLYTSSREY